MRGEEDKPTTAKVASKELQARLQRLLEGTGWQHYQMPLQQAAAELGVDISVCAAALACALFGEALPLSAPRQAEAAPGMKMSRYRLEVGRKQHVTEEAIKNLLVEESGVERRMIARLEIHNEHTLLQLPDGMPQEIYQHLKNVQFNRHPLRIRRIDGAADESGKKTRPRRHRRRNKAPRPPGHRDANPPQRD